MLSGGCLFPDALLQLQNTTHALVNALLCDFTGFYSLDYRVESLREHLRTEQAVSRLHPDFFVATRL